MSATLPISPNDRTVTLVTTVAGQVAFPFDFPVLAATDLFVEVALAATPTVWTPLSYGAGAYTVSGVGQAAGGTVILAAGRAIGDQVRIDGAAVIARATAVSVGGRFSTKQTNYEFDRLTIIGQELRRDVDAIGDVEAEAAAASDAAAAAAAAAATLTGATTKLASIVSVKDFSAVGNGVLSDQEALVAAVAFALSTGAVLFWPVGTYVSTASIPSLHLVRHTGPGVIKRGTSLFYPDPVAGQTNTLYIAATGGSSTFDGLSASEPMAQLTNAFAAFKFRGRLRASWIVQLAAGTYTGSASASTLGPANEDETNPSTNNYASGGVWCDNYLIIRGADVGYDPISNPRPVPTTIFDGGNAARIGIQLNGHGIKVKVRDIKFINYNGSTSSGGIIGNFVDLRTENVHGSNNYYAISNFFGRLEPKGGDIYGTASKQYIGIRSMFAAKHEVGNQNASGAGQGPRFRFLAYGLFANEEATGHADYCTFEDCGYGIWSSDRARVNFYGSTFARCTVAVRCDMLANIYYDTANFVSNFNVGTADANGENIVIQSGAIDSVEHAYSSTWMLVGSLYAPMTISGTTTETAVLSRTLTRGRFAPAAVGASRLPILARFSAWGTKTGTAGTLLAFLSLGGSRLASVTISATATGGWSLKADVVIYGSASQTGNLDVWTHDGAVGSNKHNNGPLSIDMLAAARLLSISLQTSNSGDSVTVNGAYLELAG